MKCGREYKINARGYALTGDGVDDLRIGRGCFNPRESVPKTGYPAWCLKLVLPNPHRAMTERAELLPCPIISPADRPDQFRSSLARATRELHAPRPARPES